MPAYRHTSVFPVLRRLGQKDLKFKASGDTEARLLSLKAVFTHVRFCSNYTDADVETMVQC